MDGDYKVLLKTLFNPLKNVTQIPKRDAWRYVESTTTLLSSEQSYTACTRQFLQRILLENQKPLSTHAVAKRKVWCAKVPITLNI